MREISTNNLSSLPSWVYAGIAVLVLAVVVYLSLKMGVGKKLASIVQGLQGEIDE